MYRVEDYPQIKDNFYLKARNIGASRTLNGDIEVIVCYLKTSPTDFAKHTKVQFASELHKACGWLTEEAARYGAKLSFKYRFFTIDAPEDATTNDGYNLIKKFFKSESTNMDQLQKRYETISDSDESPFILVFDKPSRSFAHKQPAPDIPYEEISTLFKSNDNSFKWSTIAHELLHQFGAIDYYYPKEVTECAEIYIKNSIMGVGYENVLDDFTAYLVGIKDTISASTYHFLKKTMWMDYDKYVKQIDDAWKV